MKLLLRLNLVLFLVFAVGLVTTGFVCRRLLQQNAKAEIMENARIMMETAIAVRTYTATQIKPLLETQMKYSFLPQSVPAYSANAYFSQLQKAFPAYAYKEATHRASDANCLHGYREQLKILIAPHRFPFLNARNQSAQEGDVPHSVDTMIWPITIVWGAQVSDDSSHDYLDSTLYFERNVGPQLESPSLDSIDPESRWNAIQNVS